MADHDLTTRARAVLAGLGSGERQLLALADAGMGAVSGRSQLGDTTRLQACGALHGYALTDLGREVARLLLTEEADRG